MKANIPVLRWENKCLELLDQRYLPHEELIVEVRSVEDCYHAIKDMVLRGAPLIGTTAIYGAILSVLNNDDFHLSLKRLESARPTAVNLSFELKQCLKIYEKAGKENALASLIDYAKKQYDQLHADNLKMADIALKELDQTINKEKYNLVTICNTGYLACGEVGTALGVISEAHKRGKLNKAYPTETRPYLQGSRLTCYELKSEDIPYELIVEGAFSYVLENLNIDAIFVGADRIAKNGDTANKVGTSTLSIVAKNYGIPFYVVAPSSSFDLSTLNGADIEIEMRPDEEITQVFGKKIAPNGTKTVNPSFDVTKNTFITGIICEKGIIKSFTNDEVQRTISEE